MTPILRTAALLLLAAGALAGQARLLDLVEVAGVRDNHLRGIGLVIGLNGTGDGSALARQLAANMAKRLGNNALPQGIAPDNMAVVLVTATLPPFARPGAKIDVTVSSMGDAKSLRGGTLVETPLTGPDNTTVYAVANGALLTGAVSAQGNSGSRETVNHPTVGRITGGAIVELEVPQKIVSPDGKIVFQLREASYETAKNLADEVNRIEPGAASAKDGATIEVRLPASARQTPVDFLARLGDVRVKAAPRAKVIISERNGTIVAGADVVVLPVAITHSNLSISVKESFDVSQPNPFSEKGVTTVTPKTDVSIQERGAEMRLLPGAVGAGELARALNTLGVSPLDLITIFQLLKAQGALQAELIIQ